MKPSLRAIPPRGPVSVGLSGCRSQERSGTLGSDEMRRSRLAKSLGKSNFAGDDCERDALPVVLDNHSRLLQQLSAHAGTQRISPRWLSQPQSVSTSVQARKIMLSSYNRNSSRSEKDALLHWEQRLVPFFCGNRDFYLR